MQKKIFSVRMSDFTRTRVEKISQLTGMSKTELVTIAIHNLFVDVIFDYEILSRLKSELILNKIDKHNEDTEIRNEMIARLESIAGYQGDFYPFFLRSNRDYILKLIEGTANEYDSTKSIFKFPDNKT